MLSKLYRYITHPPHNLDGENYPHFRNQTDKDKFTSDFIEGKPLVEVNVSLLSFDRATITITNQQTNVKLGEISGFKETKGSDYTRYGGVVGGQRSARTDAITFELQLDYWLTYGPLNTNGAICKITRIHAPYLQTIATTPAKFYLSLSGTKIHPAYYSDEDVKIPKVYNDYDTGRRVNFNIPPQGYKKKVPQLYRAVVMCGDNHLRANELISDLYPIAPVNTYSDPGIVIGDKYGGDVSQNGGQNKSEISTGSNVSYVTNSTAFFYGDKIEVFDQYVGDKLRLGGDVGEVKSNSKFTIPPASLMYLDGMHYMRPKPDRQPELMYAHNYLLGMILANGGSKTFGSKDYRLFGTKNKAHYYFSPYLNDVGAEPESTLSLLPIKMVGPEDTTDNTTLRLKSARVTPLSHINERLVNNPIKCNIDIYLDDAIPTKKNSQGIPEQEIKYGTYHCDYIINFSTQGQKIDLSIYAPPTFAPKTDRPFKPKIEFDLKQFLTLNNTFYGIEPRVKELINARNLGSIIFQDNGQFPITTDTALKFYQQQGASYKVGLDQAQYQADYTKKYGALNLAKNIFTLGAGAIAGTIAGASKGMGGAIGAGAGGAIGFGLGTASGVMQYQNQMKQANYHLKQVKATAIDATTNPQYTSNIQNISFNRMLTYANIFPNVDLYEPLPNQKRPLAYFYHQNGARCSIFEQIIDTYFNQPTQRHQFNYGQIENIEQAIVKGNYPKMVIDYFNALFNRGVRLWNTFYSDVKFNDYTLANIQQNYYNTLPEK